MKIQLATFLIFLLSIPAVYSFNLTAPTNGSDFILTSCVATLYPDICYTSLAIYAGAVRRDPARLARLAVNISLKKTHAVASFVKKLSREAHDGAEPRAVGALQDCLSNFGDAVDEIRGSLKQMREMARGTAGSGGSGESFGFQMSNVQTWMSAALTDQDTCMDGFEDVADGRLKTDILDRTTAVKKFTSNALALINIYAEDTAP